MPKIQDTDQHAPPLSDLPWRHTKLINPSMVTTRRGYKAMIGAAFVVVVLIVLSLLAGTWIISRDEQGAMKSVSHTREMLQNLANARAATVQIELATQSYRISGEAAQLAERDTAIERRERALGKIYELAAGDERQMARWNQLREVINQRLTMARQVEALRKAGGVELASAYVSTAPLRETRALTYHLLDSMEVDEQKLLDLRLAAQEKTRKTMSYAGILVTALLILLLAGTHALIRRQLRETESSHRRQEEAQRLIECQNEILEQRVRDRTGQLRESETEIRSLNAKLGERVHELEHVSRALRTLSAANRAMLRAKAEPELLDSMCKAIVAAGAYDMAIVWYKQDDEAYGLRAMAQCGYPRGLDGLQKLRTTWADDPRGRGVGAQATRTGQTCLVRDMRTAADYAAWREHLGGHASGLAFPLRVEGKTIGSLALYSAEPDSFDADEIQLLTESAEDLAFGIAMLRSLEEQVRTQVALDRLAYQDALTGLPNETRFNDMLRAAAAASLAGNPPFAVLQVNVQRLREVNDALGFEYGDRVLQEFAARLQAAVCGTGDVVRLRGDEFAVLLPGADRAATIATARRIEMGLTTPFIMAGIPLELSASVGVVFFPQHGSTPHDLLRHVDIATRQSRDRGQTHVVFNPSSALSHPARLQLAADLRRAIEDGGLRLFVQPKVDMASGRICGAEALVRWQHPQRGLVSPGEFITLAEQTGLIKPLTEWMLQAVLRQQRAWSESGEMFPVAVNLSARNLHDESLPTLVRRLLHETGVPARTLELELTESVAMEDPELTFRVLKELRAQGLGGLYIDDFGTGYSSLSYLARLPVDSIKIDQSFVLRMGEDQNCATIVRSTIDLAHDLERTVVAEGVETLDDWRRLHALGCDVAQGHFIARPMPAIQFLEWVKSYQAPCALTNYSRPN